MPSSNKQSSKGCLVIITTITAFIVAITGLISVVDDAEFMRPVREFFSGQQERPDYPQENGENSRVNELEKELRDMKEKQRRQKEDELKEQIEQLKGELEKKEQSENSSPWRENQASRRTPSLTGTWQASGQTGVSYNITQYGNSIVIEEYSNLYGLPFVSASGQGTISGKNVNVTFTSIAGYVSQINFKIVNSNKLRGRLGNPFYGTSQMLEIVR